MMKSVFLIGCTLFIHFGLVQAFSPPGSPQNVSLLADNSNIAVSWEPPTEIDGNIRRFIVTWAILPDSRDVPSKVIVNSDVTMAFIAINYDVGRMFRIRVRGENKYGVGDYSIPRYIRIGCGNDVMVNAKNDVMVTSPGYNSTVPLRPGVVCKWSISADSVYVLSFKVETMNLLNSTEMGQNDRLNCPQKLTYVNVSTVGLLCDAESIGQEITTQHSSIIVTLITGLRAGGNGFSLRFRTTVKRPGPPSAVRTRVNKHAIVVSWQPPIERTLPITSYIVHYEIIPDGHAYRIIVAPVMTSFPINTDRWQGKLLRLNVTAMIQDLEGETSRMAYARAVCQDSYYLQLGQSINITSPNYPDVYPNGVVCIWSMRSSPEATLRMMYIDFQLEDLPFCSSDYVKFSFKREQECARMKVPHVYDTGQQEINITMVTNNVRAFKGFVINIMATQVLTSLHPGDLSTAFPTKYDTTKDPVTVNLNSKGELEQTYPVPTTELYEVPSYTRRLTASQNGHDDFNESSGKKNSPSGFTETTSLALQNSSMSSIRNKSVSTARGFVTSPTFVPNVLTTLLTNTFSSLSTRNLSSSSTTTPMSPSNFVDSTSSALSSKISRTVSLSSITSKPTNPIPLSYSIVSLKTDKLQNYSNLSLFTVSSTHKSPSSTVIKSQLSSTHQSFSTEETVDKSETSASYTEQTTSLSTGVEKGVAGSDKFTSSKDSYHTVGNIHGRKDDADKDKSRATIWVPVLLSVGGSIIVVCVVVFLFCRRHRRRRKVNVENVIKYRSGHIELHDIIRRSSRGTCQNSNDGIFKTLSSRDVIGNPQPRTRHSTFPLCCPLSKRKVHREIQRQMAVFGTFIEDKAALETRLRRRHAHRRTNSF